MALVLTLSVMVQKQVPEHQDDDAARADQARKVAEEYAEDQREIIKRLSKSKPVPLD